MNKQTRLRRAAKYVIGDLAETAMDDGEDISAEAAQWGVTVEELDREVRRQVQALFDKALKGMSDDLR